MPNYHAHSNWMFDHNQVFRVHRKFDAGIVFFREQSITKRVIGLVADRIPLGNVYVRRQ